MATVGLVGSSFFGAVGVARLRSGPLSPVLWTLPPAAVWTWCDGGAGHMTNRRSPVQDD